MVAGTGAGGTDVTDKVSLLHGLAFTDSDTVHVGVCCLVAVLMIQLDEVAVTSVAAGKSHHSVGRGIDRGVARCCQVNTFVPMTFMCNRMYPGSKRRGYPYILGRGSVRDGHI